MRYVSAKKEEKTKAEIYRIYVSDCLRALINNDSNPRYIDMIKPQPIETRTADEIINDVKNKLQGR